MVPTSVQELESRLAHSTALVCRLHLQYDVSAILAEAESEEVALPQVLQAMALNAKDVVWIPDLREESEHSRHLVLTHLGWCNAVAFPLQHGQKILGVIELVRRDCETLEDDLKSLLRVLGRDIGRFIESVRYEEELEKRNARLAQAQLIARQGTYRPARPFA